MKATAEWYELHFPIKEGQEIGVLKILADDKEIGKVSLYSAECRDATWKQRFLETQRFLQIYKTTVLVFVGCMVLFSLYVLKNRRQRKLR